MGKIEQFVFNELYSKYKLIESDKDKFYLIIKDKLETEEDNDLDKLLKLCLSTLATYSKELFCNGQFVNCIQNYLKNDKKIDTNDFVLIENVLTLSDYTPDYEESLKILKMTESFVKKMSKLNEEIDLPFLSNLVELYKLNNGMLEDEEITDLDKIAIEDDLLYTPDDVKAYLKEIGRYPLLSIVEERQLLIKYKEGDMNAYTDLINSNLRLVVYIARRYKKRGLSLLDLIQEGNIGLMKGIERFDINKNVKLSSYVSYWIKCFITKAIREKGRLVRISKTRYEMLDRYKKEISKLTQKLKRKPEESEILSELNISRRDFDEINSLLLDTVSLNKKVDISEDSELGDFVENESINVEEEIVSNDFKDNVRLALIDSNLTSREMEIIEYIFDLNGIGKEYTTMRQISKIFNVTPERIRQIKETALEKLRDSEQMRILYNNKYIEENKEAGKYPHLRKLYIQLNNYPVSLVDTALNYLSTSEHEVLNIRYGRTEKDILRNPLTVEERDSILNVRKKLISIMEKIKKGTFRPCRDSNAYREKVLRKIV